jgi:undecaprenyl-diphosphatase
VNTLGYVDSLVLGVLQGITEFLPISSSAHLALVQRWLALDPDSPALLLFDVLVHIGTLVATFIVFRKPIARFVRSAAGDLASPRPSYGKGGGRSADPEKNPPRSPLAKGGGSAMRILILAIVACVPTGVIGVAFKDTFESAFGHPKWIGLCLLVTGAMLAGLAITPRGRRGWRRFGWFRAALVGLAQGLAILPGISRSGSTICVASYCGLRRRWAAQFSFLIAAPAILGATILKLRDTLALPPAQWESIPWGPLLVGSLASLIVGVLALRLLLVAVRRAKLHYFAPYCWALALIVLLSN